MSKTPRESIYSTVLGVQVPATCDQETGKHGKTLETDARPFRDRHSARGARLINHVTKESLCQQPSTWRPSCWCVRRVYACQAAQTPHGRQHRPVHPARGPTSATRAPPLQDRLSSSASMHACRADQHASPHLKKAVSFLSTYRSAIPITVKVRIGLASIVPLLTSPASSAMAHQVHLGFQVLRLSGCNLPELFVAARGWFRSMATGPAIRHRTVPMSTSATVRAMATIGRRVSARRVALLSHLPQRARPSHC